MKSETLFGDLKKLAEKEMKEVKSGESQMDMPKSLASINFTTNLVMPIEENLTPQLPPKNYGKEQQFRALVQTSIPITEYNSNNLNFEIIIQQPEKVEFPPYKPNPIKIQGFHHKI